MNFDTFAELYCSNCPISSLCAGDDISDCAAEAGIEITD